MFCMDINDQGFLLVVTSMVLLISFALAVLAVMLIYRRRKEQHAREITTMQTRFDRELLRSQLEIQQQTMKHIGREIHDNVAHRLTLAYLYLHQLPPLPTQEEPNPESIGTLIDEALTDLRGLSRSLTHGQAVQQTPLGTLLQQECDALAALQACTISFQNEAPAEAGKLEVNSFVLRIVQEFAQNSLKHSQCTEIRLRLAAKPEGLYLSMQDNGRGFEPETLQAREGIGLVNMRQRAEIIGAQLHLNSSPGKGTHMELLLPNPTTT